MTSIVLFEPNEAIAKSIQSAFAKNKIRCDYFEAHHLEGDESAALEGCDGVLIGGVADPLAFAAALRKDGCSMPIIGLLDHRNSEAVIQMLGAGFDDVMIKPVSPVEVIARIKAVIRRGFGHMAGHVQIGEVTAYLDGRDPEVGGQRVKLSHREHSIFIELALRVGKVVSKELLYDTLYGKLDSQPFDKVIDVYICKLRKKLASVTNGGKYIETVYGRGYKLEAPGADEHEMTLTVIDEQGPVQQRTVIVNQKPAPMQERGTNGRTANG